MLPSLRIVILEVKNVKQNISKGAVHRAGLHLGVLVMMQPHGFRTRLEAK